MLLNGDSYASGLGAGSAPSDPGAAVMRRVMLPLDRTVGWC